MESTIKTKRCSVKLNRLSYVGITPAEVQEQILDQRIRRCAVRLQRCAETAICTKGKTDGIVGKDAKMRRCCIRLPRLNLVRSELSSRAGSVTSARILSESELDESEIVDH
ncbi:uncharacterized protein LOC129241339 [Anastrepha obliqua]|uniref:uncharacterized protein LOC128860421 n=1 Tax=Anastrepha ludens TaxID=28586 RepID=UPI0023B1CC07|nr:uncharacterized protein LOC128860421 [Anastrepha ludens]XP_054733572.1 uncharacterized protein LOC129241339 [Anastrepha obliqua]